LSLFHEIHSTLVIRYGLVWCILDLLFLVNCYLFHSHPSPNHFSPIDLSYLFKRNGSEYTWMILSRWPLSLWKNWSCLNQSQELPHTNPSMSRMVNIPPPLKTLFLICKSELCLHLCVILPLPMFLLLKYIFIHFTLSPEFVCK
jgi:hypothetical protein